MMKTLACAALWAALLLLGLGACGERNLPASQAIQQAEKGGDVPTLDRDSTLAGVDADGNGIRDDIDAWINKLADTEPQKQSLRQSARAKQKILLLDVNDQKALVAASEAETLAVTCRFARYPSNEASSRGSEIEKLTVNTRERLKAYAAYAAALSGKVLSIPNGDNCDE